MRTIDYPKARNRPQPAGSNRRVDLAVRPCGGRTNLPWEYEGGLRANGAEGPGERGAHEGEAHNREAGRRGAAGSLREVERARCDRGSILKVKLTNVRQGPLEKVKLAPCPVRYPPSEKRAPRKWPWTEALVQFSRMRQRCHPATLVWMQFARLLTFRQKQPNALQQQRRWKPCRESCSHRKTKEYVENVLD